MRVDFSDWYTGPGLVARHYTYSQMGGTRDTEIEIHFDIQAGMSIFTFVNFFISDVDLQHETPLRGSLRPIDESRPEVSINLMGKPLADGGVLMAVMGQQDQRHCLASYLAGKDMHFEVRTIDNELLLKLPLPNDTTFKEIYMGAVELVQAADDAQFEGKDSLLGRIRRFRDSLR